MIRFTLLLLCCVSLNAQSITVSGTTYELTGNSIKSDPNTYLHQFIEDARERDIDFSGVVGRFEFLEGTGSTKGYSIRSAACQGNFLIRIQRHFWNNYDGLASFISGSDDLWEQRRHLIYHELGHALLRYTHNCNGVDSGPTRLVIHDIMFAPTACVNAGVGYAYTRPDNWERQLDRLFDASLHSTYQCSNPPSGKKVILDY